LHVEITDLENSIRTANDDLNKFIKQYRQPKSTSTKKEQDGVKKQLEFTTKEIEQLVANIQKLNEEKRSLERSIEALRKPELSVEKALNEITNLKREQSKLAYELIDN